MKIKLLNMVIDKRKHLRTTPIIVGGIFGDNLPDEHTADLDPQTSREVMALTQRIVTEQQLTTLMITHKMSDALTYGNRLVMVQDGQIKLDVRGEAKQNLQAEDLMGLFSD